ncbi:hypothetical protein [Desulfobacter vibrioformis]|uniref:hypothetical protein n=1 Tax=Desulfobacter vibrioformis TaxID=34031 RepID=UPI0005558712|nr:hypothetical protein [Desulfobacter vibrioformis]
MKLKFEINNPCEPNAGISPFSEILTVEVESGDPGGYPGEFCDAMKQFLTDWYDGADVIEHHD